jgi:hypothetical protein
MMQHFLFVYSDYDFSDGAYSVANGNRVGYYHYDEHQPTKEPYMMLFSTAREAETVAKDMAAKKPGLKITTGSFTKIYQGKVNPEVSISTISEKGVLPDGF